MTQNRVVWLHIGMDRHLDVTAVRRRNESSSTSSKGPARLWPVQGQSPPRACIRCVQSFEFGAGPARIAPPAIPQCESAQINGEVQSLLG